MRLLLTFMGQHLAIVFVACLEILIAVLLLVRAGSVRHSTKAEAKNNSLFDECMNDQGDIAYLIMSRKDMLPVYVTGNLEELIGISFEMLNADVRKLFSMVKSESVARSLWKSYTEWDTVSAFDRLVEMKDGRWIRYHVTHHKQADMDLLEIREYSKDHEVLEKYRNKFDELENESQSKTSFLYRMSHEIRTPMNGIIGMIDLAEGKLPGDSPALQYLSRCDELSQHLLSLINDILDMSRIEAGKVEIEHKEFSIQNLGNKLYDMFKLQLQNKGVNFEVRYEGIEEDRVIGDELRLSQILINFLSNAVKFTEKGEVIVTIAEMSKTNESADFMFRVHDTGIGMPTDFLQRIFKPFEQESSDTGKIYGGTGLGMAITDQLVKLMGGEIVVDSKQGLGSDFAVYLTLPLSTSSAISEAAAPAEEEEDDNKHWSISGYRILVAEDNEINSMIMHELLDQAGAVSEFVTNGLQALEAVKNHPEDYYDCILMDIQMPVMDGRTACAEIRKLDRKDVSSLLIYALSADAFTEDERMSASYGMNGHFVKPLNFTLIENTVGRQLAKQKERQGR